MTQVTLKRLKPSTTYAAFPAAKTEPWREYGVKPPGAATVSGDSDVNGDLILDLPDNVEFYVFPPTGPAVQVLNATTPVGSVPLVPAV